MILKKFVLALTCSRNLADCGMALAANCGAISTILMSSCQQSTISSAHPIFLCLLPRFCSSPSYAGLQEAGAERTAVSHSAELCHGIRLRDNGFQSEDQQEHEGMDIHCQMGYHAESSARSCFKASPESRAVSTLKGKSISSRAHKRQCRWSSIWMQCRTSC